jgi:hypothetical protein
MPVTMMSSISADERCCDRRLDRSASSLLASLPAILPRRGATPKRGISSQDLVTDTTCNVTSDRRFVVIGFATRDARRRTAADENDERMTFGAPRDEKEGRRRPTSGA